MRRLAHLREVGRHCGGPVAAPNGELKMARRVRRKVELETGLPYDLRRLALGETVVILPSSSELPRCRRFSRRLDERATLDGLLLVRHQRLVPDELSLDVALGEPVLPEDDLERQTLGAGSGRAAWDAELVGERIENSAQRVRGVVHEPSGQFLEFFRIVDVTQTRVLECGGDLSRLRRKRDDLGVERGAQVLEVRGDAVPLIEALVKPPVCLCPCAVKLVRVRDIDAGGA